MAKNLSQPSDPLAALKALVKAGRLPEIKEWMFSGKPFQYDQETKRFSVLEIAVKTGFYSVVEALLDYWKDRASLNRALERALDARHPEIARLLVERGADINYCSLSQVAECQDQALMRFYLSRKEDVCTGDELAKAIRGKPRALVGVFKEYCAAHPEARPQLAKALKHFIFEHEFENHEKWVSLCLWMGADPRLVVAYIDDRFGGPDGDPHTSALEDVYAWGAFELIKHFKLDREKDDTNKLMSRMFCIDMRALDRLIEVGGVLNNKPNGGSVVLDTCFEILSHYARLEWRRQPIVTTNHTLEGLISRGARFVPDDDSCYRTPRQVIRNMDRTQAYDFVRILAKATDSQVMFKLLNTAGVQKSLGMRVDTLMAKLGIQLPETRPTKPPVVKKQERRRNSPRSRQAASTDSGPRPASVITPSPVLEGDVMAKSEEQPQDAVPSTQSETTSPAVPEHLTRQALYEAIWTQPMSTLAARFGLSDVGLAKICRKHDIPRPRRG